MYNFQLGMGEERNQNPVLALVSWALPESEILRLVLLSISRDVTRLPGHTAPTPRGSFHKALSKARV